MVEVLGTGTPAVETEGEGAIGAFIGQIIGFLRKIVEYVMANVSKIIEWSGEHPLAASTFFMNMLILFS